MEINQTNANGYKSLNQYDITIANHYHDYDITMAGAQWVMALLGLPIVKSQ